MGLWGCRRETKAADFDAVLLRIESEVVRAQLLSTLTLAAADAPIKLETRNYPDISTAALLAPRVNAKAAHSASRH